MSRKKTTARRKKPVRQMSARPVQGSRPGEVAYPVKMTVSPMPDGSPSISVDINVNQFAIPDKRYAADVAGIEIGEHQIKLLFGQSKIGSSELRSLVIISMSPDAVRRFIGSCESFIPDNQQFMSASGIDSAPLVEIQEEPRQTVAMTANIASLARAGHESTADFYHASPQSFHALRTQGRNSLAVDSILSVDLPIAVLCTLILRLDSWCKDHEEAK